MMSFSRLQWSSERKWITAAFCLALLLMVLVNLISYQNATQLIHSAAQVKQTNAILTSLTNVSEGLTDIEARHWRYLLLGDRSELDRYDLSIQRLTLQLEELQHSLSNSEAQKQRLEMLKALVQQRKELFQQTAIAYQQQQRSLFSRPSASTQGWWSATSGLPIRSQLWRPT